MATVAGGRDRVLPPRMFAETTRPFDARIEPPAGVPMRPFRGAGPMARAAAREGRRGGQSSGAAAAGRSPANPEAWRMMRRLRAVSRWVAARPALRIARTGAPPAR